MTRFGLVGTLLRELPGSFFAFFAVVVLFVHVDVTEAAYVGVTRCVAEFSGDLLDENGEVSLKLLFALLLALNELR